jgi:hypothetical protein
VINAEIQKQPEIKQEKLEAKPADDENNLFTVYDYNKILHINFNNETIESDPT